MHIVVVGLNHKVAPVEVRERLAFTGTLQEALARFGYLDGSCLYTPEGVILSTCNRLEIYTLAPDLEEGQQTVCRFLEDCHDQSQETFSPYLYTYTDEQAISHLFTVAAGLDSMVLGEDQILGQVAEAMEQAMSCGAAGKMLTTLFRHAVETGKHVRTKTAISQGATSVSHVAVELAQNIFGDLSACHVLLVGAGEMAELAARTLVVYGAGNLSILNRTRERAEQLAAQFEARALGWEELDEALKWADIIIASTGAPHAIFRPENVRQAIPARRNRPLFFIDIAVPRNVDPAVERLNDVYLYDIDDLEGVIEASMAERQRHVPKVKAIVAEKQQGFMTWWRTLDVVPTIVGLQKQAEGVRQAELERTLRRLSDVSDKEREIIRAMTKRIVNKLLHQPIIRLKKHAASRDGYQYAEVARDLFGLDEQEGRT
ncbi:MAG: glutamyl-tRNA reductase [Chloroflexi bacterium]|nr:glutamyl-tRNA reductase [Chloroflexota bacterium]